MILLPIPKATLQAMRYDGNAIARLKKIKKFIPIIYESVIVSAAQSKSSYTYTEQNFVSDIFNPHDAKMQEDLTGVLVYVFPGCSIYYSEKKDIGGNRVGKSITIDWSAAG